MRNIILSILLVANVLWLSSALAEEVREIQWQDLIPATLQAADPLAKLSEEDRSLVSWVILMRQAELQEVVQKDEELKVKLNEALAKIKEKGLDPDRVIAWQHEYHTAVAPELKGTKVRLAGYLMPLEMSGKAVKEFLLVPYVGACIHVPPPPLNQIVHVTMQGESDYSSDGLFEPVAVTGVMSSQAMTKDLFLADGSDNINIGYSMRADHVELYTQQGE